MKIISARREKSQEKRPIGTLYIVSLPIGNLEDISVHALRILREVDVVAAKDTRKTQRLLRQYGIRTTLTTYDRDCAAEKTPVLLDRVRCGTNVALVSDGGTPGLYDSGSRLITAAHRAGVPIVPIPGASALTAALAVSGLPGNSLQFHGRLPAGPRSFTRLMRGLKRSRYTGIFFVAPGRLRESLARMHTELGNRRVVVALDLTKATQQIVSGTLASVLRNERLTCHRADVTVVLAGSSER